MKTSSSRPTLAYIAIFAVTSFVLGSFVFLQPSRSLSGPAPELESLRQKLIDAGEGGRGWDHVYVINLESRPDRRSHMESLSEALGIPFTFINAVATQQPVVPFILENLLLDQNRADEAGLSLSNLSQETGWGADGDLTWRQHALQAVRSSPIPHLATSFYPLTLTTHSPASPLIYPPKYRNAAPITPLGPTACYLSHLKAWSAAIANEDVSFLVLEDDVDAEFNLASIWQSLSRSLSRTPNQWDMVYLGWIWSDERRRRPMFSPYLRRSTAPAGCHAYSFSARGVRRAWKLLAESPTLFQRPIDHDLPGLMEEEAKEGSGIEFEAYSAVPPLIIPGGHLLGLGTDLGGVGGIIWGGLLSDSATERYRRFQGDPVRNLSDQDVRDMMAVSRM